MATVSPSFTADAWAGRPLNIIYAGITELVSDTTGGRVAIAIRNSTDLVDLIVCSLHAPRPDASDYAACEIVSELKKYREKHGEKIISAALHESLVDICPSLCSRLWGELDIVPLVLDHKDRERQHYDQGELATFSGWHRKELDERADSMVRKCIRSFGIGHVLHNHINFDGSVDVDRSYHVHLASGIDYGKTVEPTTWSLAQYYAHDLKQRKVNIAFFSMTCQGKPDVPTRHALARFTQSLGARIKWFVPKPRPGMIPLIRKMQDTLEGLGDSLPDITIEDELLILDFAYANARRYWLCENGPLRPRAEGGVDVVIIDSAPLLTLALLSKQQDPERPVIFESSLQPQGDSLGDPNSPQSRAWEFIRTRLAHVDMVVSLLPKELAPRIMPEDNVGYIPFSVDQLDGQNKPLTDWDMVFYGREFSSLCRTLQMSIIRFPEEQYMLHLSQFRPGDGTLCLLESYGKSRDLFTKKYPGQAFPKLLICHHGPFRSPEGSVLYDTVMTQLDNIDSLASSVCIIPIGALDQMWNALVTNAVALVQLSTLHGVPELFLGAIQKETLVISIREAELFPFIHENDNTILVNQGDTDAIAQRMVQIFGAQRSSSEKVFTKNAKLPDENTTVGNAVSWMYLASKLSRGDVFEPRGGDIYELAREEAESYGFD
ncbi:heat shock trehalose synthase [Aspergillus sclerotioniger CBS 115572]|uniref:Heat shock trehalose synthase n=1 Tax=Aspergillus sclerotioniger CBS 115572 TaxID=1450535 RepID=A0A317XGD7_9EURO|nr:heat shock trehalose synthase [Aspergillus sclerotioniger CBS 115572]PWY95930.1 heat shock trehalose synthase [Aspergillus sclerotioniger CBS 115572]